MRKKRFIIIIRNLESSCDEKYKDVLKKQLWGYKFTSER